MLAFIEFRRLWTHTVGGLKFLKNKQKRQGKTDVYPFPSISFSLADISIKNVFNLCGILKNGTKQKQSHRCRKQTYGYQGGKGGRRDKSGDWDWHVHTTIYKLDN